MALSVGLKSYSSVLGAKYFCHIWVKMNDNYSVLLQQIHYYVASYLATNKPVISLIVSILNHVNTIKIRASKKILNLK